MDKKISLDDLSFSELEKKVEELRNYGGWLKVFDFEHGWFPNDKRYSLDLEDAPPTLWDKVVAFLLYPFIYVFVWFWVRSFSKSVERLISGEVLGEDGKPIIVHRSGINSRQRGRVYSN